ncbi:MAG: hypothetical protein H6596_02085 [Flavobacteriales bacterium]|nr:hypothetical protein [Flavobacteriales bacterium]
MNVFSLLALDVPIQVLLTQHQGQLHGSFGIILRVAFHPARHQVALEVVVSKEEHALRIRLMSLAISAGEHEGGHSRGRRVRSHRSTIDQHGLHERYVLRALLLEQLQDLRGRPELDLLIELPMARTAGSMTWR